MADFLCLNGLEVKNIIIQQMWDLPISTDEMVTPNFQRKMHFIANVSSVYRPFVRNWNYDTVQLSVTAKESDCEWARGKNIGFIGWFSNDELLANELRKSGGFGLVWHDDSWWVEYMKLNASYKIGTYLAAGIPVIVSSSKAEKDIILHKNLGLVVDSLDEAVAKVKSMTEEQYNQMKRNVDEFGKLLRGGYFTKKLLTDAVFQMIYG